MNKILAPILLFVICLSGSAISKKSAKSFNKPVYENAKVSDSHIQVKCEIDDGELHCEIKNINDLDTIYVCTMSDVSYYPQTGDFTLTYSNYTSSSMNFPIDGRVLEPGDSFVIETPDDFKIKLKEVFNKNKTGIEISFVFDYIKLNDFPRQLQTNNVIMKNDYMRYSKKLSFDMKPI